MVKIGTDLAEVSTNCRVRNSAEKQQWDAFGIVKKNARFDCMRLPIRYYVVRKSFNFDAFATFATIWIIHSEKWNIDFDSSRRAHLYGWFERFIEMNKAKKKRCGKYIKIIYDASVPLREEKNIET